MSVIEKHLREEAEMNKKAWFEYNLKYAIEDRSKAAQKKGRLTPKGHSSSSISGAHNGSYMDACNDLSYCNKELSSLLYEPIKAARKNGLTWKAIKDKYKIPDSVLKVLRERSRWASIS